MTYEFTFLLNDEKELKKIEDLVKSLKGKVVEQVSWGKKTLAYPIKKNTTANFYNWTLMLDKQVIKELKKKLNFNEKMIRYLLLKSEEEIEVKKKVKKKSKTVELKKKTKTKKKDK